MENYWKGPSGEALASMLRERATTLDVPVDVRVHPWEEPGAYGVQASWGADDLMFEVVDWSKVVRIAPPRLSFLRRLQRWRLHLTVGACGACGHTWADHPADPPDAEVEGCGECDYEITHGLDDAPAAACRLARPTRPDWTTEPACGLGHFRPGSTRLPASGPSSNIG